MPHSLIFKFKIISKHSNEKMKGRYVYGIKGFYCNDCTDSIRHFANSSLHKNGYLHCHNSTAGRINK